MRRPWLLASLAWTALALLQPSVAASQQVRVTGTTSLRYLEVRPFRSDSVAVAETNGTGLLRRSSDGQVVRCIEGETFCRFLSSADAISAAPMIQDLTISAWGLGRGIRAYGRLRGRAVAGDGRDLWPLSQDHFDALAAYLELDRPDFRVRAGRQWKSSGLGYYNFDGGSVLVRLPDHLSVELYGGRSLIRGVGETRTGEALAAVEPFAPKEADWLVGGHATWRAGPAASVSLLYQREIRRDRDGLYAERMALDGLWRRGRLELSGTLEADIATSVVNEARLETALSLAPGLGGSAFARHHRPFFEAWTIWGAFDPIGFDELGARAWWRPLRKSFQLEVRTAWRRYPDANAATTFETYRDTGWRLSATTAWSPDPSWSIQARVGTDVSFGAARDDASVRVEKAFGPDTRLALSGSVFERVYEFRVEEGSVWALAVDGGTRLHDRLRIDGSFGSYFHRAGASLPGPDWSQLRGTLTLRWTVGAEPGMAGTGGDS